MHCGSLDYKAKIYLQTLDADAAFHKTVLLPWTEAVLYMYSMKPEKEYTAVNLIYFTPFEQKLLNGVCGGLISNTSPVRGITAQ